MSRLLLFFVANAPEIAYLEIIFWTGESSSAQLSVAVESLSEQYNSPLKEPNTSLGKSFPAQVFRCLLSPRVMSGNTPDNQM